MTYYEKNKKKLKKYYKSYYKNHKAEILERAKNKYFETKKKTPKCKMCGVVLPKELHGCTKYCDKCLYGKGHGEDAGRMSSVRYERKKRLDKKKAK